MMTHANSFFLTFQVFGFWHARADSPFLEKREYILMPVVRGGVFEVVTSKIVWWFADYILRCGIGRLPYSKIFIMLL